MRFILVVLLCLSLEANGEMLWKPEAISFEIVKAHEKVGIGFIIEVHQRLEPEEFGWTKFRLDIPEHWAHASLHMKKGTIYVTVGEQEYYVNSINKGKLQFEILGGGYKTDAQLLEIWNRLASST